MDNINWHTLDKRETLEKLSTDTNGLSKEVAKQRLTKYGPNKLPDAKKTHPFIKFLQQFDNILIYVLLGASVVTAIMQDWLDTIVILLVVFINAVIGHIQEGKAEKTLENLKSMLSQNAMILREGKKEIIPAEELVPGDIVILKSGEKIPADLRILEAKNLKIEESALTGESLPSEKNTKISGIKAGLGDRKCMAYSGTSITYGSGLGVVVATGIATEIGKISNMLQTVVKITTPLINQINRFGKSLSVIIVGFAALIFAFGYFTETYSVQDLFLAVIGITVAAIPEGLPALMTITLALGIQKMAQKNAIIRRLPSVETLGSVTVICSDKTGTLTKNEMTVRKVITNSQNIDVTGSGYNDEGELTANKKVLNVTDFEDLLRFTEIMFHCNDADVRLENNKWQLIGDPTEGALKSLGLKAKLSASDYKRIDVIPFDSAHKFMAVLLESSAGEKWIFVKGAAEKLLEMCKFQFNQERINTSYWNEYIYKMASEGIRVMGAACKKWESDKNQIEVKDLEEGLLMVGLCGMIDPPRPEVITAINDCKNAGISVKMITGDHALTASSIANKIGISNDGGAITGQTLDELSEAEWKNTVKNHHVFARTTPEHKLKLVQALQENGEITAMTGDGINDAPALKKSNIGIAMGIKGTEVTKEAAEMVLLDDNFASIVNAVKEGRTIYDNLKKAILFILPTNGAEAFVIVAALLMGATLPITAAQILWVNMITAVTLGIALAFEPAEPKVMSRKPRNSDEAILSAYMVWRILYVSAVIGILLTILFKYFYLKYDHIELARSITVNALIIAEAFYLLNCRHIRTSIFDRDFFANKVIFYSIGILIVIQIAFTHIPFMYNTFSVAPLNAYQWLMACIPGLVVFLIVEAEKFFSLLPKFKKQ